MSRFARPVENLVVSIIGSGITLTFTQNQDIQNRISLFLYVQQYRKD